jgi:hypothetical protein
MPRGNNKISHPYYQNGDGFGRSYDDVNKEIIWICIIMATIITILILLALIYIAFEKWSEYKERRQFNFTT